MMPRLQAERQLRAVEAAVAANPMIEARSRRHLLDAWQLAANAGAPLRKRVRERPLSRAEFEQRMAELGMTPK